MNFSKIQSAVFTTCLINGEASLLPALNFTNEIALLNAFPSSTLTLPKTITHVNNSVIIVNELKKLSQDLNLNFNGSLTKKLHEYIYDFKGNLSLLYENI